MADEKDSGFKVTDRRMFNPDGSLRDDLGPAETKKPGEKEVDTDAAKVVAFPGPGKKKEQPESDYPQPGDYGRPPGLPQPTFSSLINMLAVEAAMHLGLIENPTEGGSTPVDLEAARHMIDSIGMLQEKTRGNLTADEAGLVENILVELRMQFVAQSRPR